MFFSKQSRDAFVVQFTRYNRGLRTFALPLGRAPILYHTFLRLSSPFFRFRKLSFRFFPVKRSCFTAFRYFFFPFPSSEVSLRLTCSVYHICSSLSSPFFTFFGLPQRFLPQYTAPSFRGACVVYHSRSRLSSSFCDIILHKSSRCPVRRIWQFLSVSAYYAFRSPAPLRMRRSPSGPGCHESAELHGFFRFFRPISVFSFHCVFFGAIL